MELLPFKLRKRQLFQSRAKFIQTLRSRTREPYFDNKNSRRRNTDDPDGTIYAEEYNTMISLRNEVLNRNWMVYKTLIVFPKNQTKMYFWTISYPGHFATVLTLLSILGIFVGVYFAFTAEDFRILPLSAIVYLVVINWGRIDYSKHTRLIKDCADEF